MTSYCWLPFHIGALEPEAVRWEEFGVYRWGEAALKHLSLSAEWQLAFFLHAICVRSAWGLVAHLCHRIGFTTKTLNIARRTEEKRALLFV